MNVSKRITLSDDEVRAALRNYLVQAGHAVSESAVIDIVEFTGTWADDDGELPYGLAWRKHDGDPDGWFISDRDGRALWVREGRSMGSLRMRNDADRLAQLIKERNATK